MNTGKEKFDEMLQARRPVGLKTGLGYFNEKHIPRNTMKNTVKRLNINIVGATGSINGTFRRENLTNIVKRRLNN